MMKKRNKIIFLIGFFLWITGVILSFGKSLSNLGNPGIQKIINDPLLSLFVPMGLCLIGLGLVLISIDKKKWGGNKYGFWKG